MVERQNYTPLNNRRIYLLKNEYLEVGHSFITKSDSNLFSILVIALKSIGAILTIET